MAKYLIGNIKGPKGDRGEAGPTYTAGTGIDITNNVISTTGGPAFSGDYNDLTNKPDLSVYAETADLATVATSGSYNDLTNKPDLSVYATTTALGTGLARKQDTLTAGTNITIDANNVISAAGGASVVGYEADNDTKIRIGSSNNQTKSGYIIGFNNTVSSTGDIPVVLGRQNSLINDAGAAYTLGYGNTISSPSTVVGKYLTVPQNYYGEGTIVGKYNDETGLTNKSHPFIVGTGTSNSNRRNGLILDYNANLTILGKMTVGAAPTNDMDVATKKYVDDNAGGGGSSLPTDPSTDGTYFLSNTISSGVSTKAWVSIPAASGNNF